MEALRTPSQSATEKGSASLLHRKGTSLTCPCVRWRRRSRRQHDRTPRRPAPQSLAPTLERHGACGPLRILGSAAACAAPNRASRPPMSPLPLKFGPCASCFCAECTIHEAAQGGGQEPTEPPSRGTTQLCHHAMPNDHSILESSAQIASNLCWTPLQQASSRSTSKLPNKWAWPGKWSKAQPIEAPALRSSAFVRPTGCPFLHACSRGCAISSLLTREVGSRWRIGQHREAGGDHSPWSRGAHAVAGSIAPIT